ncbi:MAG: FHA domain-containing protein [Gemmatimonadota bacterium]
MQRSPSTLHIRLHPGSDETTDLDLSFTKDFRIGRDPSCEIRLVSPLVSRFHAQVWVDSGSWGLRDLGSTNGLILNGRPIQEAGLTDGDTIQLGKGAPVLAVSIQSPPAAAEESRGPDNGRQLSLSEIEEKYLNPESDRPAGERTQFIRMAFAGVQKRQKRKTRLILGAVGGLLAVAAGLVLYQGHVIRELEAEAAAFFHDTKSMEVNLIDLRRQLEESGSEELAARVTQQESEIRARAERWEGYVRERGLYRRLRTREDTLIFETARVFGESEFEISSSFIEAVLREIREYWLGPGGRSRFLGAIQRAEENGYTGRIAAALERAGVPPEFFYLALQESGFVVDAVGPETRWGRAKGMWQFIPATAERYGLNVGLRADTSERDPDDERLNFESATDAAARYLRDLHGILTQASGLLVMAAYNWGEHRVGPRLEDLPEPRDVFREEFAAVPNDPSARNYWTFLSEYEDRMPDQTKDYVIKIFSAAVIGQDPEYFGLDVENPLGPYSD